MFLVGGLSLLSPALTLPLPKNSALEATPGTLWPDLFVYWAGFLSYVHVCIGLGA